MSHGAHPSLWFRCWPPSFPMCNHTLLLLLLLSCFPRPQAAAVVVSRVAVTTTLAAGAGGLVALAWRYFTSSTWDVVLACHGALAG